MIEKYLLELVERHSIRDGRHQTLVKSVTLIKCSEKLPPLQTLNRPALCFILQGSKRVSVGRQTAIYAQGQYLSIPTELPIVGQILKAEPDMPYFCVQLDLDIQMLSDLLIEIGAKPPSTEMTEGALEVGDASQEILEALARLLSLLDQPDRIAILAPIFTRELLYYIVENRQTEVLERIARLSSKSSQIADVVKFIRARYSDTITIHDLLRIANMSPASLHKNFKSLTGMSPIQYQKQIRLLEARQLMLQGACNATQTGYRVGYSSHSQFFREYARLFGKSPAEDMRSLNEGAQSEQLRKYLEP